MIIATEETLRQFDADGQPIRLGPMKLTSIGKVHKQYQTPYGVATIERHVYQGTEGGKIYCPLDRGARIVVSSTPRFARRSPTSTPNSAPPACWTTWNKTTAVA